MIRINIMSVLGMFFAVVMAMSIFTPWVDVTVRLIGTAGNYTGWDLFNVDYLNENFSYGVLPIIVMALGMISAILFLVLPKNYASTITLVVIGALSVILAFVTFTQFENFAGNDAVLSVISGNISAAWGLYLTIGSGMGTIVFGALSMDRLAYSKL